MFASPQVPGRSGIKLTSFALAAAIALAGVACEGGAPGGRTRPNEAAPANESPTMVPETASDPFISIDAQLDELKAKDLFKVESPEPAYWRLLTLDEFDGEGWRSGDPDRSESGEIETVPTVLPQLPEYTWPADSTLGKFTFRVLSDDLAPTDALPMAQTAEEIAGRIGDITWDPYRAQAFIDGGLQEGMEYTVRSRIVVPTPEELDRVEFLAPQAYGEWTELPADLDPRIGQIAERWTADATSDYRKVLAIQQHFQGGGFVYTTDVEPAHDPDAVLEFLTQTRAGFCQHYASAMAVMVRALGLPARIPVGYRSGTQKEDGSYLVQTDDAHVWVEVLFPGYGWLPFEPEHGATHPNAQAGTYLNP